MEAASFLNPARLSAVDTHPSILSRPASAETRSSRRAPTPIVIPPPYDGDAPHKGLDVTRAPSGLSSASSAHGDFVFSPALTDGTTTPLTALGSPDLDASYRNIYSRKASINGVVGLPPLLDNALDESTEPLEIAPLSDPECLAAGSTTTTSPDTASAHRRHIQDIIADHDSACSLSSADINSVAASPTLSIATVSTSHEPWLQDQDHDEHDHFDEQSFGSDWQRSREAQLLDRAGLDAQSRRASRVSTQINRNSFILQRTSLHHKQNSGVSEIVSIRAGIAPIPVPMEQMSHSDGGPSDAKMVVENFDDEKIFVPNDDLTNKPLPPVLQEPVRSHFSWGNTAPSAGRAYQQDPYVQPPPRITAFAYAQSRHEYSKNRRMNFHLREPSANGHQIKADSVNQNPRTFAAELPAQASQWRQPSPSVRTPSPASLKPESHSPSLLVQSPVPPPASEKPRARPTQQPPQTTSHKQRSARPSFFSRVFGSCYGQRH